MGAAATIETERLTLRALTTGDAAQVAAGISDVRVLRNLTSPPYPYTLSDAEWFIGEFGDAPGHYAICREGVIGVITLLPRAEGGADDLGYWLAVDHWGQGLMTEAATAVVKRHFETSDATLTSGHVLDNTGSRNVLRKLGFRDTHQTTAYIKARGETCQMQRMELTRADWAFACDPKIETERLVMRPLRAEDASAFVGVAGDRDVARMLASIPYPFSQAAARSLIGASRYKGRDGFRWGVWHDDVLIGFVGMGAAPVSTMYALGRAHWGQGFATEAMRGFLADMLPRLGLNSVDADCFVENLASHHVLAKLGFEKTGEGMATSLARLEPAPVIAYRLAAEKLGLT